MSWQRKMRPVLIVLGLGLACGSLVGGARALKHGSGSEPTAKSADAPASRPAGGPIVLGTVDTDPPPVSYGLPPVLPSGTVAKVDVKGSAEVKEGQELYTFDSTIQQKDVNKAKAAIAFAQTKVREAEEGKKRHAKSVEVMRKGVDALKAQAGGALALQMLVKRNVEQFLKSSMVPESEWPAKLSIDATYLDAENKYTAAYNAHEVKKAELAALEAADTQVPIDQAQAAVDQAQAELDRAQAAVDLCVVRARTAGTVEQVSISPGTTLGISTRTPALWLIPAGPRVVRGEVEAEFAHRVGPNLVGKTVTVMDNSDPKLTYTGTVRHIGGTFLLKRATADNFLGGDTRVIEVVVDVADPAPAGKPPLRVGQRVRVNLGQ